MITEIFYTKRASHNPLESSEEMILNWESNATSDLKPTVNCPKVHMSNHSEVCQVKSMR